MKHSFQEILDKIIQRIDAIYLIDVDTETYTMIKDKESFHLAFGDTGSYRKMMETISEHTVDKLVSKGTPYGVFFENKGKIKRTISRIAKMRIGDREVNISLVTFPVDDTQSILAIDEIEEEEAIKALEAIKQTNAVVKSAYLFTMNVDLVRNRCEQCILSEVDDIPASERELSYTDWRDKIIHMFKKEDQEIFWNISDPVYLKEHLNYQRPKSDECQMMNLEGEYIWVRLIFNRINTGNDNDFRFIFMVENIHESHTKIMEDLIKYGDLATVDSLTQILNRGRIELEIVTGIERCRSERKSVSLIMFDLDHFKQVNDTYGHAVGDYVLKTIATIASSYIYSNQGKIGRWGGEEFMGILEDTSVEKATEIAEEIRKKIAEHHFETVGNITSSFGVIEVLPKESEEDAFKRVDAMLYQAKIGGRNKVVSRV